MHYDAQKLIDILTYNCELESKFVLAFENGRRLTHHDVSSPHVSFPLYLDTLHKLHGILAQMEKEWQGVGLPNLIVQKLWRANELVATTSYAVPMHQ